MTFIKQIFRKKLPLISLSCIAFSPLTADITEPVQIDENMKITPLGDGLYIHTTWHNFEKFGRFPSNGVIYVKEGKALLLDTPVTNEQTKQLVNVISNRLHAELTLFIPNHFHNDCMGGLEYLQSIDIPSISLEKTREICEEKKLPVPDLGFNDKQTVGTSYILENDFSNVTCYYPGAGHTIDNISVYFHKQKVLFGGCLIKSIYSKGLGNLADAIPENWPESVGNLMNQFPEVKIVIPGHGSYGDKELLIHTKKMTLEYLSK